MARVQLEMPAEFLFATEIPVRISDINYAGHLGNDAVLSLLQEARVQFLASYGLPEMDIFGVSMIITDSVIVYRSEAFHGEILRFEVTVNDFNRYGCDFVYHITEKNSRREVARAKTGMVFFDYQARRVQPVPPPFLELFSQGHVTV